MNAATVPSPFKRCLLQGIEEHLSSPGCRYVDNSLAYYAAPGPETMREDKEWFARHPLPQVAAFLREHARAIDLEVLGKSLLYGSLADKHSRDTLVLVSLYALLGHRFVKFPYYAADTITRRATLARRYAARDGDEAMRGALREDAFGVGYALDRFAVPMGEETVTLYTHPEFLYQLEAFPPYRYASGDTVVEVARGDYVLDCGACYGDTALMFAAAAGPGGRVLSFEPHPDIGRLFLHNLRANPRLADRITLVPAATGCVAGGNLTLCFSGAGSHIAQGNIPQRHAVVPRTSLDAEIARRRWPRVDFIKMDVEGSELASLQGAVEILRRFRPKLAVCLYHSPEDFFTIPQFLLELDLGYRFYLEHHYMNNWETVLYALPPA